MPDYQTNAAELMSALGKDPETAAKLLLDLIDERINSGLMEPIEDLALEKLLPYLTRTLENIQAEAGPFAKFFGDLADDPDAAVAFLLGRGDALVNSAALEPLVDSVARTAQPILVAGLAAQQEKLRSFELTAED